MTAAEASSVPTLPLAIISSAALKAAEQIGQELGGDVGPQSVALLTPAAFAISFMLASPPCSAMIAARITTRPPW